MRTHLPLLWVVLGLGLLARAPASDYYPPRGEWKRQSPEDLGLDSVQLQRAVAFSIAHQKPGSKDPGVELREQLHGREPILELVGPTPVRGGMTGVIIRRGSVVATWGDPDRVEMAYSLSKTYLTTVVGLAWQDGRIRSVHDRVRDYLPDSTLFSSPHNAVITWDQLLRQTSNWSGSLWGISDSDGQPLGYAGTPLYAPGTHFNYNNVRVNVLALAALQVWRRPLPQVLRERLMDPIGCSDSWRWYGQKNAWVTIDGQRMPSVSGGGGYGGGMVINAWDLARFGYLFLRQGEWKGRQIVSRDWIKLAKTPGSANAAYGFANWCLNPRLSRAPEVSVLLASAPASSVVFHGHGANIIYLDWEHDLVVVVRWINDSALDPFIGLVLGAIKPASRITQIP